jgi:sugar lactone lactonase YvrE
MNRLLLILSIVLCSCTTQAIRPVGESVFGLDASKEIPVADARLNYPEDAVEAADGTLYISDTHLHVIRRMKDGVISNFVGTYSAGYNGDGDRSAVMLNTPTGLLISKDQKYLFFADSQNGIIRRVDLNGGGVETVAGTPGNTQVLPVSGRPALGGPIGYASVLKYDPDGDMCYQTSQMTPGNTAIDGGVYCIQNNGITKQVEIKAGYKLHGIRDFLITKDHVYILRSLELLQTSSDGSIKSIKLEIQHGKGLIEDGRGVIVGVHTGIFKVSEDMKLTPFIGGFANVSNIKKYSGGLLVVDSDQGALYSLANTVKTQLTGYSSAALGALTSVTKYGDDKLLILDNQRPRIFLYEPKTGKSSLWAGTGEQKLASINVDKLVTTFYYPRSIAADRHGNVFVAEPHRIMKIDKRGVITRYAGYERDGDADSANPENARFRSVGSMSIGSDDSLYIADTYNNKIRKVSRSGAVTTVVGTGKLGTPVPGAQATKSNLNHPLSVHVAPDGELYVSDSWNNSVIRVDTNGIVHAFAGKPVQSNYQGMGLLAGDNEEAKNARLNTPAFAVRDSKGNTYISDQFNHRIRKISDSGIITTFAGDVQGYAPHGARLNFPNGLQIIGRYLYVADSGNRLIVRYKID